MCADRMHHIIIAIILGIIMGLAASGQIQIAFLLQLALIILFLLDGFAGICPGRTILRQILPPCEDKK